MTLTKTAIVKSIMETVRFKPKRKGSQLFLFPELDCTFLDRKRAAEIVDSLFEKIKESLVQGEDRVWEISGQVQMGKKREKPSYRGDHYPQIQKGSNLQSFTEVKG